MTATLETELSTLQEETKRLWERGGSEPTALTQEEVTMFSELAKSILRLTLDGRYPEPAFDSWLIPGTDRSTISHAKHRSGDSDLKTELIHYWISERTSPWLAVITDEQLDNVLTRVRVEVQRPYLPSKIFIYPPVEQS